MSFILGAAFGVKWLYEFSVDLAGLCTFVEREYDL